MNQWLKSIQLDTYAISYTASRLQIGCKQFSFEEWEKFNDEEIIELDGKKALAWWKQNKAWIFQTVKQFPAKETKNVTD